jgi:nitroreductase
MFQAALREPDHGQLKPYRFIVIEAEGLQRLGELYRQAWVTDGETDPAKLDRAQYLPTRAPMIIVAVAHIVVSDKAPEQEQLISAGIACAQLMSAAQALGLGTYWRTGELAYHEYVHQQLHCASNEKIIGFIYCGTPKNAPRLMEKPDDSVYWRRW